MTKRMSWYWALPVALGLALVVAAVTSWASGPVARAQTDTPTPTSTPTVTNTPTPTATENPECDLRVDKSAGSVGEGGDLTYTITVRNDADDEDGECSDLTVTDVVPDGTECVTASVTGAGGLSFDAEDIQDSCDDADEGDTVTWDTNSNLDTDHDVVLEMVVGLDSSIDEGDHISNTACAVSASDEVGDCDTVRVTVGEPATATPQPTATAMPTISIPTVIAPPPPVIAPLPTLSPPVTGTGTDGGGGSGPLVIGLGLAGACLLLVSGVVLVKRTR
jgi:uncharacterized repeat protein (TIGR01451 family)